MKIESWNTYKKKNCSFICQYRRVSVYGQLTEKGFKEISSTDITLEKGKPLQLVKEYIKRLEQDFSEIVYYVYVGVYSDKFLDIYAR